MKKILSIVLIVALAILCLGAITACNKNKTYEIALITDKGDIDDKSFNEGSWNGVVEFSKEHNISHKYYKPEAGTNEAYLAAIDLAVSGGAKIIVTPGFLFEEPVYNAQTKYKDVKFILLDGSPRNADFTDFKTESNVAAIFYAEQESGFLAGYAAVIDGYRNLGFMGGMAVPAVQAFGYGFLTGAEHAAKELGLDDGAVTVKYHYTGDFDETPANKNTAATMYSGGAEVIFACGGSVGKSVMSAASEAGKKVIGVDVDQRYDSSTVITSAIKGLTQSVKDVLVAYKNDNFEKFGGKSTYFDAKNNGIGLPTTVIGDKKGNAFDRFRTFNKSKYDEIYNKLKGEEFEIKRQIAIADTSGVATAQELKTGLNLTKVTVTIQ